MSETTPTSDAPVAASIDDLKRERVLKARVGPTGLRYDLRPMNLERYALTGNFPARLRAIAQAGAAGVNAVLAGDDEKLTEQGLEVQEWLDRLVAEVIVSPSLHKRDTNGDLVIEDGSKVVDPDLIDLVPPADYRWACSIGLGECDVDGEGALLWGREPLSRWATFREEHGCAEDCAECDRVVDRFSAAIG